MKYQLVNTAGQITAIITSKLKINDLAKTAKIIMRNNKQIEQVGYLEKNEFTMMGGELSINGTLAAAYLKKGSINNLKVQISGSYVSVTFPKNIIKKRYYNTVVLEGISYYVMKKYPKNKKITKLIQTKIKTLALNSPAAGLIYLSENKIIPLVYVKQTDTYTWENACGSGSLAASLISRKSEIYQPSGDLITITSNEDTITISTTARRL